MGPGGRDLGGFSRSVGAVLLAAASIVALSRKSGAGGWTDFELMLVVAVPALLLFVLATGDGVGLPGSEPWRAVLLILSVLLSPVALLLFLRWAGASTEHLLYDAGVLVVSALIAIAGARRTRTPYAILLAGLALLLAWLLVWLKLLHHPSPTTVRWVILAGGALLLIASTRLARRGALGARELGTAGGLGAVIAGVFGVFVGLFDVTFGLLGGLVTTTGEASSSSGELRSERVVESNSALPHLLRHLHVSGAQTHAWDIYLVCAAAGLIWLGARARSRGLAYAGAFGLLMFVLSTGVQLARLEGGHAPSHSLAGWPLVLLVIGLICLLAPAWRRTARR